MSIQHRVHSIGTVFGDWKIMNELGSGSNGKTAVFRIVRSKDSFEEESALKIVNIIEENGNWDELSQLHKDEYTQRMQELRQKAIEEVRVMYQLQGNSTIVNYLDYTTETYQNEHSFGCDLYIRMELLENLYHLQRRWDCFTEDEIIRIGKDICTALALCHEVGILHRDIKPSNIFRNKQGGYKLGDFGISRIVAAGQSACTHAGTEPYAAPEQFSSEYDNLVDIYSLGLTLYELGNQNRLPFADSSYANQKAIQRRLLGEPFPAPVGISESLATVIMKACAYEPQNRFDSAVEFEQALQNISIHTSDELHQMYDTALAQPDSYGTARALPRKDTSSNESMRQSGHLNDSVNSLQGTAPNTDTQIIHVHTGLNNKIIVALLVSLIVIVITTIGSLAYLLIESQNDEDGDTPSTTTNEAGSTATEIIDDNGNTDPSAWGTVANADLYPIPTRTLLFDKKDPMKGGDVKYVQAALDELQYRDVEVNGIYDANTEAAVERFQKKHGLPVTGEVESNTLAEIQSVLAESRADDAERASVESRAKKAAVTEANIDLYPVPERSLDYGTTGEDVKYVQSALTELSYYGVKVMGVYDSGTQDAVARFQKKHGCTIDGIVGPKTLSSIQSVLAANREEDKKSSVENEAKASTVTEANADLYPVPERSLKYGATGEDVRYVQAALVELSYYGVKVNGVFDAGTEDAVERFQKKHGRKVDGVVGPKTLASIQSVLAESRSDDAAEEEHTEDVQEATPAEEEQSDNTVASDEVNADIYPVPERTLEYYSDSPMTGEDVKYVQAALIEMNYTDTPISVNGIYDADTAEAVKRFQQNHGLTVDGVVGAETTQSLQSALVEWRNK